MEFRLLERSQVLDLLDAGEIQDSTKLITYFLHGAKLAR